jgi:molybdopterin converting factor small subunit
VWQRTQKQPLPRADDATRTRTTNKLMMMIKIKVLFFASAREAVGGLTELSLELPPAVVVVSPPEEPADHPNNTTTSTTTTKQLRLELAALHPHLADMIQTITLAVNEEYVHDDDDDHPVLLYNGDTVALIPPISGG